MVENPVTVPSVSADVRTKRKELLFVCLKKKKKSVRDSCVVQSTLFQLETLEKELYDYALPFDDMVPINTFVGDWEEL